MSDIVERLRIKADMILMCEKIKFGSDAAVMQDAAVEIERLRAALVQANSALAAVDAFEQDFRYIIGNTNTEIWKNTRAIVRAALSHEQENSDDHL